MAINPFNVTENLRLVFVRALPIPCAIETPQVHGLTSGINCIAIPISLYNSPWAAVLRALTGAKSAIALYNFRQCFIVVWGGWEVSSVRLALVVAHANNH